MKEDVAGSCMALSFLEEYINAQAANEGIDAMLVLFGLKVH